MGKSIIPVSTGQLEPGRRSLMPDLVGSRSDGVYAIYDVPSGTYWLVATKDGYTLLTTAVVVP